MELTNILFNWTNLNYNCINLLATLNKYTNRIVRTVKLLLYTFYPFFNNIFRVSILFL